MSYKTFKHLKYIELIHNIAQITTLLRRAEKLENIDNVVSNGKKGRSKRKFSVCPRNHDRKINGFMVSFLNIKQMDNEQFFTYTRMTPQYFDYLLSMLKPYMTKKCIREPISPECRLAVLLVYLAQGSSMQSLARTFKMGRETVRIIVLETAELVWNVLSPIYVCEQNEEDFKAIEEEFWETTRMPNCVGSVDGKHVSIKSPSGNPSESLGHERLTSIVLIAACDVSYRFTFVDVGGYGNYGEGDILRESSFAKRLLNKDLPIPPPKNLPDSKVEVPHYFAGGAGFPLAPNIMRPYEGKMLSQEKENFNKRLLRSQRTVENALGILVARWRILLTTLHILPQTVEKIILACVALHNFVMADSDNAAAYVPPKYADWEDEDGEVHEGLWRSDADMNIPSIAPSPSTHHYGGRLSTNARDKLCDFLIEN